MAEPADQQRDLVGEGHRGITGGAGSAQELSGACDGLGAPPPVMPLGTVQLLPAPLGVLEGAIGAILQIAAELLQVAEDVEDVAPAGDLGQGQGLAGTQPAAGVGDGGLGIEALVDQLQQAHAPGLGVAMVLQAQQVAIGRGRIDADEHRVAGLKDLIVGPDANAGQVVTSADGPSRFDGAVDDVVHRTQGELPVEEVAEQLDDGPVRAMADQHQSQDQLPQPGLGDRQVEEDVVGLGSLSFVKTRQHALGRGVGVTIPSRNLLHQPGASRQVP